MSERESPREFPNGYRYKVWQTGLTWACHATSPSEWFREYGFPTAEAAHWWGEDAVREFLRNDEALAAARV